MRWLLVSADHHPDHGGVGAAVAAFVRGAAEQGWQVELITRAGDRRGYPAGGRVRAVSTADCGPAFAAEVPALRGMERIRPFRYGTWSLAAAAALLESEVRPDAVEFVDSRAEGLVALTSRRVRGRYAGVPMLIHAHTPMFVEEAINGADPRRFGRRIYHRWERKALAAADGILLASGLLGRRLATEGLTAPQAVIPPLFEPAPIDPGPPATPGPSGPERLLLVGTVQGRKGIDTWLASLAIVLRRRPAARAMLIGPGPPAGVPHPVRALPAELRDRLEAPGRLEHRRVLEAIAAASVVVVPSRFESFSFVAAEALAAGRAVVVSDRVGLAEHVPGLTVVPAGDHRALARAQLQLLLDRPRAAARARAARQHLARACAAPRVLAARAAFLARLRPAVARGRGAGGPEAIEVMARYLRAIRRRRGAERPSAGAGR